MTGIGVLGLSSFDHTLIERQFSSLVVSYMRVTGEICGQILPNAVAWKVSVQAGAGCGGFQRFSPPVVAANGMPMYALMPSTTRPCTLPLSVVTSGDGTP